MASLNTIIGNYHLVEELSSGSFGRVYRAEHAILTNRIFAIKLLHGTLNSPKEREGFIQEARLLEKLKHPYILPINDVGFHEGFPYMVTEYASNGSLRKRLHQHGHQPLPAEEALTILWQIGQALQHAHNQNIIHRDLKPENILFNVRGEALLADFGISTVLSSMSIQAATIIGTPPYMAPEQFKGVICKEADQYALACIAYELFTGQQPFTAPDFFSIAFKHLQEEPTAPRQLNRDIPKHVEQAILKAMAMERKERYSSVSEFLVALQVQTALNGNEPTIMRPPTMPLAPTIAVYPSPVQNLQTPAPVQQRYTEPPSQRRDTSVSQKRVKEWLDTGDRYYDIQQYDNALAAYEEALRFNPNDTEAYMSRGDALEELGQYEEALIAYEQVIRLDPHLVIAYYNKGEVLHALKRYEEAITAYQRVIEIEPDNFEALNNIGDILADLELYENAIEAYNHAIDLDPDFADAYYNKGVALELTGRAREAKQCYKKAKELGYKG